MLLDSICCSTHLNLCSLLAPLRPRRGLAQSTAVAVENPMSIRTATSHTTQVRRPLTHLSFDRPYLNRVRPFCFFHGLPASWMIKHTDTSWTPCRYRHAEPQGPRQTEDSETDHHQRAKSPPHGQTRSQRSWSSHPRLALLRNEHDVRLPICEGLQHHFPTSPTA